MYFIEIVHERATQRSTFEMQENLFYFKKQKSGKCGMCFLPLATTTNFGGM